MMKDKYCDTCGKKFPPQHSTGNKDVDEMLREVTTCTDCLKSKIKQLMREEKCL